MEKNKKLQELLFAVKEVLETNPIQFVDEYGPTSCIFCDEYCYFSGKHNDNCEYIMLQKAYENYIK